MSLLRKRTRITAPQVVSATATRSQNEAAALSLASSHAPAIARAVLAEALRRRLARLGIESSARKRSAPMDRQVLTRVGQLMRRGAVGVEGDACDGRHCNPKLRDFGRLLPGQWLTDAGVNFAAQVAQERNAMQLEGLARRLDGSWLPSIRSQNSDELHVPGFGPSKPATVRESDADTGTGLSVRGENGNSAPGGTGAAYNGTKPVPRAGPHAHSTWSKLEIGPLSEASIADARRRAGVFVFRSFFLTALLGSGRYDYSRVQRWTRTTDVFALRRVVFPVN